MEPNETPQWQKDYENEFLDENGDYDYIKNDAKGNKFPRFFSSELSSLLSEIMDSSLHVESLQGERSAVRFVSERNILAAFAKRGTLPGKEK